MKRESITLDVEKTGQRINKAIKDRGYKVADIQKALNFECPQSIYRWLKGKALPSIDNLFLLSKLLDVPMQDLLVAKEIEEAEIPEKKKGIWD